MAERGGGGKGREEEGRGGRRREGKRRGGVIGTEQKRGEGQGRNDACKICTTLPISFFFFRECILSVIFCTVYSAVRLTYR